MGLIAEADDVEAGVEVGEGDFGRGADCQVAEVAAVGIIDLYLGVPGATNAEDVAVADRQDFGLGEGRYGRWDF